MSMRNWISVGEGDCPKGLVDAQSWRGDGGVCFTGARTRSPSTLSAFLDAERTRSSGVSLCFPGSFSASFGRCPRRWGSGVPVRGGDGLAGEGSGFDSAQRWAPPGLQPVKRASSPGQGSFRAKQKHVLSLPSSSALSRPPFPPSLHPFHHPPGPSSFHRIPILCSTFVTSPTVLVPTLPSIHPSQ